MWSVTLSRVANIDAGERPWPQDDPDAGYVAAAQADPRAFALLYERYRAPIYRYCYNRLRRHHTAEEATADVFLEAFANLLRYPGGPFASWLYTIAAYVVARYQSKGRETHTRRPAVGLNRLLPPGEIAPVYPAEYLL